MLTACNEKIEDKDKEKDNQISYTNKYECIREENLTLNEKNTSEENAKIKYQKRIIHDFNKEGSKLLGYYEIETYTFTNKEDLDTKKEKYNKKCDGVEKYGYTNCKVTINDKTITIKKESDLANEYNKEKSKMTMESIKKDYEETSAIYKCS